MKLTNLRSHFSLLKKLFFCTQIVIATFALPALCIVELSHNTGNQKKETLWLTNKGKHIVISSLTTVVDNSAELSVKKK